MLNCFNQLDGECQFFYLQLNIFNLKLNTIDLFPKGF